MIVPSLTRRAFFMTRSLDNAFPPFALSLPSLRGIPQTDSFSDAAALCCEGWVLPTNPDGCIMINSETLGTNA